MTAQVIDLTEARYRRLQERMREFFTRLAGAQAVTLRPRPYPVGSPPRFTVEALHGPDDDGPEAA